MLDKISIEERDYFVNNNLWTQLYFYKLDEEFIDLHFDKLKVFPWLFEDQVLSCKFLDKVSDKITRYNWIQISRCQFLELWFIEKYSTLLDWDSVLQYQYLPEEVILKYLPSNHKNLYMHQKFSEDYIRDHLPVINTPALSLVLKYQKLSEAFILEIWPKIKDHVDITFVFMYQKLSEEFILGHLDIFGNYINCICRHQKLSSEAYELLKVDKDKVLEYPYQNSWIFWIKEYKRKFIKNNTKYEIVGDKVIAYKSTRIDGHSVYNFQYKYEVGGEYESNADYNHNVDNSYGLSAWTQIEALGYYNQGKLFKVEIDLEDIACITSCGKIRARKIKVLEEVIY